MANHLRIACTHLTQKFESSSFAVTYFSHFMICYYFICRLYGQVCDPAMLKRLQTEYDAFFVRATRCIFSSQRLGAWQFLAVVPYNTVSMSTLWRIFYSLHEEYQEEESLVAWTDTKTGDFLWIAHPIVYVHITISKHRQIQHCCVDTTVGKSCFSSPFAQFPCLFGDLGIQTLHQLWRMPYLLNYKATQI
jgi:hypothetical protein